MRSLKRLLALSRLPVVALAVAAAGLSLGGAPFAPAHVQAQTPAAGQDSWTVEEDFWYVVELGGGRVGWMNSLLERSGENCRMTTEMEIKISRGVAPIEIRSQTVWLETADGQPISVTSRSKTAKDVTTTIWEFADGKIRQTVRGGGRVRTEEAAAPAQPWLPMHAAAKYAERQRETGAEQITYSTVSPDFGLGKVATITSRHAGTRDHLHMNRAVTVEVWKETANLLPGMEMTSYLDSNGEMLYQETPLGGIGKMVMRRADEATAKAEIAGHGPELMLATFVTPSRPIENSMKATRAKLKLTVREGTLPDLPSAGAQRVEMSDDRRSATLTIDIHDNLPADDEDAANDEYRRVSTIVDHDADEVKRLAARAADRASAMDKAEALRRIANRHINRKGLETAFASASETARERTGDCSEHGVLLAALLRAEGIPSRLAMGLVYADEFLDNKAIFGWHMWTQALIDGKWVDLDATLPVRYNAAHVLTAVTPLSEGVGATEMVSVLQLIGNLDIEVLEVGYGE